MFEWTLHWSLDIRSDTFDIVVVGWTLDPPPILLWCKNFLQHYLVIGWTLDPPPIFFGDWMDT